MRIAILGSGGVGGYFGGRLAAAGSDVRFIARGAHLAALRERGLRIESPDGNVHVPRVTATDDPSSVGPVDIVFFVVKLYDTESAIALLPPLLGPDTLVVPFQNGVDSVDRLTRAIGRPHVAGGTTYVTATIAEPGVIRHTALDRLIFGPLNGPPPPVLEALLQAAMRAGITATLSDRINVEIWTKFVRLSVLSGMTAVTRCSIGPIMNNPDLRAMLEAALRESIAVARGKQIAPDDDVFERTMAGLTSLPPIAKSSMLVDLEHGRRLELPWLSGAIVRLGAEAGVDTPVHRTIVTLLSPHVNGSESG